MKRIERITLIIFGLFVLYMMASFLDVTFHNLSDQHYGIWNAFEILFGN